MREGKYRPERIDLCPRPLIIYRESLNPIYIYVYVSYTLYPVYPISQTLNPKVPACMCSRGLEDVYSDLRISWGLLKIWGTLGLGRTLNPNPQIRNPNP